MKFIKWLLGGVAVIVVLVVAAIVLLPMVVPMDRLVAEGAARVEDATGRKLTVGGKPELSLWPEVAIRVEKVAFANAKGAPDAEMATAEAVRIAVPVLPLLSGNVEVKEFVLVKPDIRLFVDADGRPNWTFGDGKAAAKADEPSGDAASGKAGLPEELRNLKLGDVRIEDGRISYVDARSGATEVLEDVDLKVALPDIAGPLELDGELVWKGERVEVEVDMAKPLAALEAGASALEVEISGKHLEVDFDGEANFAKAFALAGAAEVETPSIRNLAAWAATPIEIDGDVLGPFKAKGKLAMTGGKIAFNGAELAIDAIEGKGDFSVDASGKVPSIVGKLALGALDLNPYMGGPKTDGAKPATDGDSGKAGPGQWNDAPIDFSGLKTANAVLSLTVESLRVQDIEIGRSALSAILKNGVLNLNLAEMALYGGSGTGTVTVDASKQTPRVAKTFALKGIEIEPLLTDAAGFSKLSGKGDLDIKVSAVGGSEAELVKTADGGGAFALQNGAVKGFNLAAIMRKAETAFLDSSAGKRQQTDFSELTGTFKITNGIVTNDDLRMLSPLFRVTGAGQSSLPARTVDYRVEPKAVASKTGQGGKTDLGGVAVPVIVKGPWHNISYTPDLSGVATDLLKDPGKTLKAVGDVGGKIADQPKKAVEGVLKGAGDPAKKLKGLLGN